MAGWHLMVAVSAKPVTRLTLVSNPFAIELSGPNERATSQLFQPD